jgi:hypothetical protein
VQRLLNKAISDGSKVGIFHVAHPVDTTRALLGMLLAIATWYRADGRLSPTQLAERYVEIALNTVGCTRRPRR